MQEKIYDVKKSRQLEAVRFTQEFVDDADHELERTIKLNSANQNLVQKINSSSFPRGLQKSYAEFRVNPNFDQGLSLLLDIDTWIVQAQSDGERFSVLVPTSDMVAINSVIDRREVLRIELDREDHELAKITTELDIYRLPITQREEQEADEVGFDFYVTSRFEPKFLG